MSQPGPRRLQPIAYLDTLDWRDRAECKGKGNTPNEIERWFPGKGGGQLEAMSYCDMCQVRRECEEYAAINQISDGIWGGKIRKRSSSDT